MSKPKIVLVFFVSIAIAIHILQMIFTENNYSVWSLISLLAAVLTLIGLILSSKKVDNRNQGSE